MMEILGLNRPTDPALHTEGTGRSMEAAKSTSGRQKRLWLPDLKLA
jgi:hypothetical protein